MAKHIICRIQDLHHIAINLERALVSKQLGIPGSFCHIVHYELFKQTYKKCIAEIENGCCSGNTKTCQSFPCNSRDKPKNPGAS
jgi:hypothetical protein